VGLEQDGPEFVYLLVEAGDGYFRDVEHFSHGEVLSDVVTNLFGSAGRDTALVGILGTVGGCVCIFGVGSGDVVVVGMGIGCAGEWLWKESANSVVKMHNIA